MASIADLPIELIENVLGYLPVLDLVHARNACQKWRSVCDSNAIDGCRRRVARLVRKLRNSHSSYTAICRRVAPFLDCTFDRHSYLSKLSCSVPTDFETWLLEYPDDMLIGWHWPGLKGEHSKGRYEELGINWVDAMCFSRHMKPGYTLLPSCQIEELRFPALRGNDARVLRMDRKWREALGWAEPDDSNCIRVKALQIWVNWSSGEPEVTWLLLSGAGKWNGSVWWTQPQARFGVQSVSDIGRISTLTWDRKITDSWLDYLAAEWSSLQDRYDCLPHFKGFRMGGNIWMRQTY